MKYVASNRNRRKIFKQIVNVANLHVIFFTMYEKDLATEVYLDLSDTCMMKLFYKSS